MVGARRRALGSTGSVSVTSGATLLISQNQQMSNTAAVSLSDGTIRTTSEINETFGNLSVTGNSFLDFGTTSYANANTIGFGTYTTSALLAIDNFNFGSTMTFKSNLSSADLATFSFTNGGIASSSWDGFTGPTPRVAESCSNSLISAPSTSWANTASSGVSCKGRH